MNNTCENCKHEATCHKTIGIMFGYCNIDFEPKNGKGVSLKGAK